MGPASTKLSSALEATQRQKDGFFSHSHTNATSKRWHLWEIDLRFALNSTPGWGEGFAARSLGGERSASVWRAFEGPRVSDKSLVCKTVLGLACT